MSYGLVNTLESKIDKTGGNILNDLTIDKDLTIHNTLTTNNNIEQTNGIAKLGNIDIYPFTQTKAKIDFQNTSYIIENEEGYLSINQTPKATDYSKKIATTEWIKKYPVPFTYTLVDNNNNLLNIGTDTNPVYFKDGVPVATQNILDKDISDNAATATYAVDAGHAVNADEAIHAVNSDNAVLSTNTDKFNKNGSITLTNALIGSVAFNGTSNINLNTSLGPGQYGFLPDYNTVSGCNIYFTAPRPCWIFLRSYRGDERDAFNLYIYSADGVLRMDTFLHAFWFDENKQGMNIYPLNTGDTIYLWGYSKGAYATVLYTE